MTRPYMGSLGPVLGMGALLFIISAPERLCAQSLAASSAEEQKTLYALGVLISRNLDEFQLTPEEFERVRAGLIDGFNHRASVINLKLDTPKVQALRQTRIASTVKKRLDDGQVFLEKAAAVPRARRTASGLVMEMIKPGTGASPRKSDEVSVNYQGKLIDGTIFEATARGEPAKFQLTEVIPCWSEALPLMQLGEKARIVCPPNLAYGLRGSPPKIASQSTLDFEVELLAIGAAPVPAPSAGGPRARGQAASR